MAEPQKIKLMSSDSAEITVGMSQLFLTCFDSIPQALYLGFADTCTDRDVAERSVLIKNMMEDIGEQAMTEAIPIPNVSPQHLLELLWVTNQPLQVNEAVLNKVIEWCVHHKGDPPAANDDDADSRKKTTDIEEWDQKFMQVDQEMLFEIILVGLLRCVT